MINNCHILDLICYCLCRVWPGDVINIDTNVLIKEKEETSSFRKIYKPQTKIKNVKSINKMNE